MGWGGLGLGPAIAVSGEPVTSGPLVTGTEAVPVIIGTDNIPTTRIRINNILENRPDFMSHPFTSRPTEYTYSGLRVLYASMTKDILCTLLL